ncbi:carbonic anhydrase family protein [Fructilactobacillus frigidiflavus]|uniref:carbonic anhydrase family protein n=1 Tax=Fructilactobacillus frigidiflavus TaxID=3242688 RepID=UPI003756B2E4
MNKMLNYDKQMDWQPVNDYWQSPVDFRKSDVEVESEALTFFIQQPLRITKIENLGNNLKYKGYGSAEILQRPYQFQQVHFHHPAEHLIDGQAAAVEVHFVFESSIGQVLVLALLFKIGQVSSLVQQLVEQKVAKLELTLPQSSEVYHYLGSLTTPPLLPGVEWLVVSSDQLTISQEQMNWFTEHFPTNARQVQPLQNRKIEMLKNK